MEDMNMAKEEKINMARKLEERSFEVQKPTHNQLDMISQL